MPRVARDLVQGSPLTLKPETPFFELVHLFVEAEIGGAPVVNAQGHVVGIITATDVLREVDQAFDEDDDPAPLGNEGLAVRTAADIASPDVVWVSPDLPLAEVAARMRAEGVHRVLVGEDGRLGGILSAFDLLRAIE